MAFILFDLDNTLYDPAHDLFSLIDVRINRYMCEVVGIAAQEVDGLRREYWRRYGVTLQGLIRHYGVDPEDYLRYVHDVDVAARLAPDPVLGAALDALPQRKAVFTNGSACHAERVLGALGIRERFEAIFDIRVAGYQPKPWPEPYRAILGRLGLSASECVMVEDSAVNLETAKALGMATVLVGGEAGHPFVDRRIDSVRQIGSALAALRPGSLPCC
jgi:putative hydrolase of the HAD superfamily